MPRSRVVLSCLLPSVLLGFACSEPPPVGTEPRAYAGGVGGFDDQGCPAWGCTGNSPVIGPYAFHELDFEGGPNAEGVSINSITRGSDWFRVELVDGNRLIAHAVGSSTTLAGDDLEGLVFNLQTPTGPYELIIQRVTPLAVSPVKMWIGADDPVETYELVYNDPAQPRIIPVCANPPYHEYDDNGAALWTNPIEAILFTGDRYDALAKTVTASTYGASRANVNLACAGSAPAKLHLARYTTASSDASHSSTAAQRQAMLKMFAGDFCGTGQPFTVAGTPLHWEDRDGWHLFDGDELAFESFWDEDGAQCITEHRLGPDLLAKVLAACPLTSCAGAPGFPMAWEPTALVKTAIPAPL